MESILRPVVLPNKDVIPQVMEALQEAIGERTGMVQGRVATQNNATKRGPISERTAYIAMAVFFAVLMLIGTFFDESIDKALFSPGNIPATLITTLGIYPYFASMVFFLGVLCQRARNATMGTIAKVACAVLCVAFALVVGFMGVKTLVGEDCLGGIWTNLNGSYLAIAIISVVFVYPLFFVGYTLAGRNNDKLLAKRVLGLLLILLLVFIAMNVFKGFFNRPRYRTVSLGLEGVDYVPWYHIMPNPAPLMEKYGLSKNEFSSFPSGHSMMSLSTIYILYSLAWLFPALRGKRTTLCVAGFVFAIIIMFTRMVLGAHYLSDVSAGALICIVLMLAYNFIQRRIDPASA